MVSTCGTLHFVSTGGTSRVVSTGGILRVVSSLYLRHFACSFYFLPTGDGSTPVSYISEWEFRLLELIQSELKPTSGFVVYQ